MGLVRNLRKKLDNLANKILVELSYRYIIQRARQTTKRQDNSSKTKSLQSKLLTTEPQNTTIVTSYQDTLEKITMEQTPEAALYDARKWSMRRIKRQDLSLIKMRYTKNLRNGLKLNLVIKTLKFYS